MDSSIPMENPLLIVLSGPSGVGKDAVISKMKEVSSHCHFAVTVTTRKIRRGEIEGKDYLFVSKDDFEKLVSSNGLLEWAEVYGNFYGVLKEQVTNSLSLGLDVMLKVDVQGARTIKKIAPEALFIFLSPPDLSALENRLRDRMTESEEALQLRLKTAVCEIKESSWFDYEVVNPEGCLSDAISKINQIIQDRRLVNTTNEFFAK